MPAARIATISTAVRTCSARVGTEWTRKSRFMVAQYCAVRLAPRPGADLKRQEDVAACRDRLTFQAFGKRVDFDVVRVGEATALDCRQQLAQRRFEKRITERVGAVHDAQIGTHRRKR